MKNEEGEVKRRSRWTKRRNLVGKRQKVEGLEMRGF